MTGSRNFLDILFFNNVSVSARSATTLITRKLKEFPNPLHYSSSSSSSSPNRSLPAAAHHAKAIKDGSLTRSLHLRNCLLTRYAKSSRLDSARKLFDEFPHRDVRSWTIILSGLARSGSCQEALGIFSRMLEEGVVVPNKFTLFGVLKCCGSGVGDGLRKGKALHCWMVIRGVEADTALDNAILDFYVKHDEFGWAEKFFRTMDSKNASSWNIMLAGRVRMGDMERCVEFFRTMEVKATSSWNIIMSGLLVHGFAGRALEMMHELSRHGRPAFNRLTYSISLKLASCLVSFEVGRQIHGKVIRDGRFRDDSLRTSLIDMYWKCGRLEKVSAFFKI
ncbi:unnamed protein product [Cuscuta campestris]|uniref:Pentacotripeptide-repeat region of PRORP domain-containing protein n=1 Tax=Cuscuta campestris TaxID=132261 RepID=A0A484MLP3_9ASTE|nr:unnamed protein product [Cuscuta campestris]